MLTGDVVNVIEILTFDSISVSVGERRNGVVAESFCEGSSDLFKAKQVRGFL